MADNFYLGLSFPMKKPVGAVSAQWAEDPSHLPKATLLELDLSIVQVIPVIVFRIGHKDGVLLIRTKFND